MITVKRIGSIGWLNCADKSINLAACIDGSSMATFVNISRDDFEKIRHDKELMKQKAADVLNQNTQNKLETKFETFLIVGRVSGEDDILMFIDSIDREHAIKEFLSTVQHEQSWDCNSDIYVEFCIPLSKRLKGHVYTNSDTNEVFSF
jgi:hypothetical protein